VTERHRYGSCACVASVMRGRTCHHGRVQQRRALILSIVTVLAGVVSCTTDPATPPPTSLLSPTPSAARSCIEMPSRAQRLDPTRMLEVLDQHVPTELPVGFGLVGVFGGGQGSGAPKGSAVWVDAACRTISVTTWVTPEDVGSGPRVGLFTLTSAVPPTFVSPGPRPCLAYRAGLDPCLVEVDVVGIDRSNADNVVRSIQ
jgi:hypothetical protein